jgi:cleavage and polyadenylation specificity factor subunit 1
LREALQRAVTLNFPSNRASHFTLTCDASDVAVGACLHQVVEGESSPIDFFSRKLSPAEARYSVFDKELLAIVASLKKWQSLVSGTDLYIFTDHKPLIGAFKSRKERFSPRQQRHFSIISEYATDIIHIAGADNVVADALSRVVDSADDQPSVTAVSVDAFDLQAVAQLQTPEMQAEFSHQLRELPLPSGGRVLCDVQRPHPRPVIPEPLRRMVFDEIHGLAHPGVLLTCRLLKDRFVWPRMEKDIKRWCRECTACQRAKITRHVRSSSQSFTEPLGRFQTVHMDLVGPLPTSPDGHSYIATFIDRSTRWIEAAALKSITADEVAQAFLSTWVARFGVPLDLITDRGQQFESQLFHHLSQILGFHRIRTTAYHPQSNGLLERAHRTMKTALRAKLQDCSNWMRELPTILLAMRIQPQANDLSAFAMVTGSSFILPNCCLNEAASSRPSLTDSIQQLAIHLRNRFVTPRDRIAHAGSSWSPPELNTCRSVWVRVDRIRRPLEAPYAGPFDVVRRSDKIFTLRRPTGDTFTVSTNRLKPHYSVRKTVRFAESVRECV